MTNEDVAIFWDYENVRFRNREDELQNFLDFLNEQGRVVLSRAYADWTSYSPSETDRLYRQGINLIQVPLPTKNSIDTRIIADGMDCLSMHPNVSEFVIITGDYDFRALISYIRQQGKKVVLVGNIRSMSQDLILMVDKWHDVSTLTSTVSDLDLAAIQDDVEISETPASLEDQRTAAFALLQDSVRILNEAGNLAGIGMTKNVMIVRNPGFDEKDLEYDRFADFIADAADRGYIIAEGALPATIISLPTDSDLLDDQSQLLDSYFTLLSLTVRELEKDGSDTDPSSILREMRIRDESFSFTASGYSSFIAFLRAAEHREVIGLEKDLRGQVSAFYVVSTEAVQEWLQDRTMELFGEGARVPSSIFIEKIANQLSHSCMTLDELVASIVDATKISLYKAVLETSGISYLPPYQKCLFFILLGQEVEISQIIKKVNQELVLLGFQLLTEEE